jgi:predicted dehydrogenase
MAKFRIVGISFDHMHMGDLCASCMTTPRLRSRASSIPTGPGCSPPWTTFGVPEDRVFTDFDACMAAGPYDMAILCAATADHADYTERLAAAWRPCLRGKTLRRLRADARRMMTAMEGTGKQMAINWPLRWVESHVTAKRLIDEGMIGDLREVHFYDGNRGPLWHLADKVEVSPEEVERQKPGSWWYKKASGGGSLLDYMGYGATLGTWYMNGAAPLEVTCTVDETPGIEVDQHAIAVCRYAHRSFPDGDPLGHLHRPVDAPAAADLRLHLRGLGRHHRLARLRQPCDGPDPRPARAARDTRRSAGAGAAQRHRIRAGLHRARGAQSAARSTPSCA